MKMINKDLVRKARQANLAEYLLSIGVPLVKSGNRYRHKEHDSLIFTKNAYYWNSQQEHGNAIDYLVKHMNMDFMESVSALVNIPKQEIEHTSIFEFDNSIFCNNQDKVKRYLYKDRHIGYSVINHAIENKLLFQEVQTNNTFFPIYDEKNICVGGEIQGILKKRFKGVKKGSKYGYGFNVRFSDDNTYDYALFFESAIDLLSFIDYKMNHEKKSLSRCIFISMAGLKINVVKHMMKVFDMKLQPVICVDNDNAGKAFIKNLEDEKISYMLCLPKPHFKDWNEQLTDTKQNMKPISRLFNKGITDNQRSELQPQGEIKKCCNLENGSIQ